MGCGSQNSSAPVQTLQGAGASFPAPIYQHWFSDLATNKNIQVNYQSVGSGSVPWSGVNPEACDLI